jgi:hypothetical protein
VYHEAIVSNSCGNLFTTRAGQRREASCQKRRVDVAQRRVAVICGGENFSTRSIHVPAIYNEECYGGGS